VQKAISYSMTSFFTTGGIRGGKAKLDKFFPRSYNMGIRREVYTELGGFSKMRFGEDIDFSYRIVEAGYKTALLPDAWVWHKRRTDFRKFFRQVFNSGIARINLSKRHPGTLKLVHLLPMIFTVGVICLLLLILNGIELYAEGEWLDAHGLRPTDNMHQGVGMVSFVLGLFPLLLYSLIIFIHSSIKNRSLWVGLLSVPAAFTQLMGYGFGFIKAWWKRIVLKQDEFTAFEKNFYK
ncbi:MAG: glycosyltransferase, partial [Prevotella sp.]|nr:glycosyltransferase [Prevotella sp.]